MRVTWTHSRGPGVVAGPALKLYSPKARRRIFRQHSHGGVWSTGAAERHAAGAGGGPGGGSGGAGSAGGAPGTERSPPGWP